MIKRFPKHFSLLCIVCVILAMPIFATVTIRVRDAQRDIAHIEREKIGLRASLVAHGLLSAVERYRIALLDQTPQSATLRELTISAVADELRELRTPEYRRLSDGGPRTSISVIDERWQALLALPAPIERAQATIPLAELLLSLLLDIDDASGLTYDPTVESINLSDAIAARLPSQGERRDQSAEIVQLADEQGRIGPRDIIRAEMSAGESHDALGAALDDFDGALQALPGLDTILRRDRVAVERSADELTASIDAVILDQNTARIRTMQRLRLTSVDAGVRLLRASVEPLATSYDARIAANERAIRTTIWIGAGAALVSFLIIAALSNAMRRRDRLELARANERAEGLETKLARRNAERALRMTEQQFRAVFDGSLVGIAIIDRSGRRIDPNGAFRTMFDDDFAAVIALVMPMFAALESDGGRAQSAEHRFEIAGRSPLWAEVSLSLIRGEDDDAISAIVMVHDITEHKTLHEQLDHQTLHDALTALPNRVYFMRRLQSLAAAGEPFAVVFIDLDRFKSVNDTLGHHAGDRLLRVAARRLTENVRSCDFVARLHGDEFALLLADIPADGISEIDTIIARLEQALRLSVDTLALPIVVSASIGVVRSSADHHDAEQYLREADAAMYRSKLRGRGCTTFYDAATCVEAGGP